ncbi:MAG: hypothetical protein QM753_05790 [Thermomicrobiales bacterium]
MSYAVTPTSMPFVLPANALQSANLFELQSSAGNIFTAFTAGGLVRGPIANASAPTYSFAQDGSTGFYRPAGFANTVRIATAATDRLQISTSAISTTLPGDMEVTDVSKGVILKSPDGNRWRVKVRNGGSLTTEAA